MRKILILLSILSSGYCFGQDANILISMASPAYGIKIKNNFPAGAGGFARAFMLSDQNASTDFIGLGVYGTYTGGVSTMNYGYIGSSHTNTFLSFKSNGNVGIGTTAPAEKLSVKGKIRAQEVKVEMANWPDFVFKKGYVLPTLQETEKHINEKGHLPGIPSAAEVQKNGIELGEMNKKLLQKIEELTLYLIEKDKELRKTNNRIDELSDQMKVLNHKQN